MDQLYKQIKWPVTANIRYHYNSGSKLEYSDRPHIWSEQSFLSRVDSIEFISKTQGNDILIMYAVTDATGQEFYLEVNDGNITVYQSFPNKWLLKLIAI